MQVFVTGATGFIGSALVRELLDAGHQVLGLARSEEGAKSLTAAGAQVHRGNVNDLENLRAGAANSDAVIHLAFNHDFSKFVANCEADRKIIETLGSELAGSDRLLIATSGVAIVKARPGIPATEDGATVSSQAFPRAASEEAAAAVAERGVRVAVVRLPQVHDPEKQGLVTYVVEVARQKKSSAYVGEGLNRWPAAHVSDTAHLYRLALEKTNGNAIYHAVAEEGVPLREVAEVIGKGLKVPVASITPEQAAEHFGWLGMFVGADIPASSELTRERLGWKPAGPGLISDLEKMNYFPG